MEIRDKADALKAFLGVSTLPSSTRSSRRSENEQAPVALSGDQVTLSMAGSRVLDSTPQEGMRLDKVSAVQQALAAGTYSVAASKVADKVIESMVGASRFQN